MRHIMVDEILLGDVYASLDSLEDKSVACVISSPPYWRQRDYGFENQIGQEKTYQEYIGRLVVIFKKLREKLRDDGIFFLNLGDKYVSQYGKSRLLGLPYKLAHHMIKSGWSPIDLIFWYKPNRMPTPVKDRFANSYEPIMVFGKKGKLDFPLDNIYKTNKYCSVLKINLQASEWSHTASFPEKLVRALLDKVSLNNGDIVLDPFAGTGTVGVLTRHLRDQILSTRVTSLLIEGNPEFVEIIKKRTKIKKLREIPFLPYKWEPCEDDKFETASYNTTIKTVITDRKGEFFLSIEDNHLRLALKLGGIRRQSFKEGHDDEALFFFGWKPPTDQILGMYYILNQASLINQAGYVLRNIIIVAEKGVWYPVIMFAQHSTKVNYCFNLDVVRKKHKTKEVRKWKEVNFKGMVVKDGFNKNESGVIREVLKSYKNYFPKVVKVEWKERKSLELVLNPHNDDLVRSSLKFDGTTLVEPYKTSLSFDKELGLDTIKERLTKRTKETKSKFSTLERINWGQSPAARAAIVGDYFSKMRLYNFDQKAIAAYINTLRIRRGMSKKDLREQFPQEYKHTIGHWLRDDISGSIPSPKDLMKLRKIFQVEDGLFSALSKTALKFQTVRASPKGRNPGDFIEMKIEELKVYLKKLYIP